MSKFTKRENKNEEKQNFPPSQEYYKKLESQNLHSNVDIPEYLQSCRNEKNKPLRRKKSGKEKTDPLSEYQEQILEFTLNYFKKDPRYSRNNLNWNKKLNNEDKIKVSETKIDESKGERKIELLGQKQILFPQTSPDLTNSNRKTLVAWLIEVHHRMHLRQETLYLTISLVDSFCSQAMITKENYQLLGATCLFIAGKYEEILTPRVKKFVALSDGIFGSSDIAEMQTKVLKNSNFSISFPSICWYLRIFLKIIAPNNAHIKQKWNVFERCCLCFSELVLLHFQVIGNFLPQIISSSILQSMSRMPQFLNVTEEELHKYFNKAQMKLIKDCNKYLQQILQRKSLQIYQCVKIKYSSLHRQLWL